jgi:hypothetical protein
VQDNEIELKAGTDMGAHDTEYLSSNTKCDPQHYTAGYAPQPDEVVFGLDHQEVKTTDI